MVFLRWTSRTAQQYRFVATQFLSASAQSLTPRARPTTVPGSGIVPAVEHGSDFRTRSRWTTIFPFALTRARHPVTRAQDFRSQEHLDQRVHQQLSDKTNPGVRAWPREISCPKPPGGYLAHREHLHVPDPKVFGGKYTDDGTWATSATPLSKGAFRIWTNRTVCTVAFQRLSNVLGSIFMVLLYNG